MSHKFYLAVSPLSLSGSSVESVPLSFVCLPHKVLLFLSDTFMTHSYSHVVKTLTHIFLHYVSGHSTCKLQSPTLFKMAFNGKKFLFLLIPGQQIFQFLNSLNHIFILTSFTRFLVVDFWTIHLK